MPKEQLKNISNPEFIEKMEILVNNIIEEDLLSEAFDLINTINKIFVQNKNFKEVYPEIYNKYKKYLTQASFIALSLLEKNDILHLLEFYFNVIYTLPDYNLYLKIKNKIQDEYDLKERDNFKKKIREVLLKNQERLTKKDIKTGSENLRPTIGNWLKDYNYRVGVEKADRIKQTQYLTDGENIKKMTPEEKSKLKILIDLYEILKISSTTSEGLEESFVAILPDGEINLISKGKPEKIPSKISKIISEIKNLPSSDQDNNSIKELENMLNQYEEGSLERKAIKEEIQRIKAGAKK